MMMIGTLIYIFITGENKTSIELYSSPPSSSPSSSPHQGGSVTIRGSSDIILRNDEQHKKMIIIIRKTDYVKYLLDRKIDVGPHRIIVVIDDDHNNKNNNEKTETETSPSVDYCYRLDSTNVQDAVRFARTSLVPWYPWNTPESDHTLYVIHKYNSLVYKLY
jgi:hypothetical protein